MTNRHREDVPTGEPNKYIRVETYYSKGGLNYSSYKRDRRGYYVSIQPIEKETSTTGMSCERMNPFEGIRYCVAEAKRLNAATLAGIAARIAPRAPEIVRLFSLGEKDAVYNELLRG